MGGAGYERVAWAGQTPDGGYAFVGCLSPNGRDSWVPWVAVLDSTGARAWERTYPGGDLVVTAAQQIKDGGFILAGENRSFGAGGRDAWCIRLGPSGDIMWQKTYGSSTDDVAMAIRETSTGNYVVVGYTYPVDNPLLPFGWCFNLDAEGRINWSRVYTGSGGFAATVHETSDGGFIVGGITFSARMGLGDGWLIKLDPNGAPLWQKAYGGPGIDSCSLVLQASDGGYLVTGFTGSFGTVSDQAWLMKLDPHGTIRWQRCYGTAGFSTYAGSVLEVERGLYLVAGTSVTASTGSSDGWCLAIDAAGSLLWKRSYSAGFSTGLHGLARKADGGFVLSGPYAASQGTVRDILVMSVSRTGRIDPSCHGIGHGRPALIATEPWLASADVSSSLRAGPGHSSQTALVPQEAATANTLICSSPARPDLSAEWRGVVRRGDAVSGSLVCVNIGRRDARAFRVRVVLSNDQRPGAADTLVLLRTMIALGAGKEAKPLRIDVGGRADLGGKYLIAIVDPDSAITEEDETNNTVVALIP